MLNLKWPRLRHGGGARKETEVSSNEVKRQIFRRRACARQTSLQGSCRKQELLLFRLEIRFLGQVAKSNLCNWTRRLIEYTQGREEKKKKKPLKRLEMRKYLKPLYEE